MLIYSLFQLFMIIQIHQAPCPDADSLCVRCGGDRCLKCIDSFPNPAGFCVKVRN